MLVLPSGVVHVAFVDKESFEGVALDIGEDDPHEEGLQS